MDRTLRKWFAEHRRWVNARTISAVASMRYLVDEQVGLMDLEPYCSAHAPGVPEVFTAVVPSVTRIEVYVVGKIDVLFKKSGSGVWRSQLVRERSPQT
jgi:hypothetical protein